MPEPKAKHIAFFTPIANGGGAERILIHLAEEFAARGLRCDFIIATDDGPALEKELRGVKLIKLHAKKTRNSLLKLTQYIKTVRPDVLLSTVFSANIAAIIAGKFMSRGTRIVIREASRTDMQIIAGSSSHRRSDYLLRKWLYPHADFVVSISKNIQAELRRKRLAPCNKSCVIWNPLTRGTPMPRHDLDRPSVPEIVACGRLEDGKDYPTLLHALSHVIARRTVHVSILGDGSLQNQLRELARKLGIESSITFVGFVADPLPFMQRATIFVHTARYEGFGNVILEALSTGCPIVATDSVGGVREILVDGKFATLVPIGDSLGIATAINEILDGHIRFPDASAHLQNFQLNNVVDRYSVVLFGCVQ